MAARTFEIYKPTFGRHFEVSFNGQTIITVDNSQFTPGKPDLTFHEGSDKNGPIIGACKFSHISGDVKVALGDPEGSAVWEELSKESITGGEYQFNANLPTGKASFTWKRHHSGSNPLSSRNFNLLDQQGTVVGSLSAKGMTTGGTLELIVDLGKPFDQMAILTCVAIMEKIRRRRAATTVDGSGGGT